MPDLEIPLDSLAISFLDVGGNDAFRHGLVHRKTVPYTIVAQPLQGAYEVQTHRGSSSARPGEVFITGANVPVRIRHVGDPRRGNIMRAQWIQMHVTLHGAVDFTSLLELPLTADARTGRRFGQVISALRALGQDTASNPLGRLARRHELALRAVGVLCEIAPMRPWAREALGDLHRLEDVFVHIRTNIAETLDLERLARVAAMSRSAFCDHFRRRMNMTPMAYVKRVRLTHVRHLLVSTDEPIYAVAEASGFANQFHLSREFKREYGVSPSMYRASHADLLV